MLQCASILKLFFHEKCATFDDTKFFLPKYNDKEIRFKSKWAILWHKICSKNFHMPSQALTNNRLVCSV